MGINWVVDGVKSYGKRNVIPDGFNGRLLPSASFLRMRGAKR